MWARYFFFFLLLVSIGRAADEPWQRAIGPWSWLFPRDHGAHPNFKSEWWYFTGNLSDTAGRPFGYQLTIFRQGLQFAPMQKESKWAVRDFYFGNFTISDLKTGQFYAKERITRGALGEARAETGHMETALGPWSILQQGGAETYHLQADEPDLAIDFAEHPAKPLILEGVQGLSQKANEPGAASYYYSYPRLVTTGHLRVGDATFSVAGPSWFDHEFSTSSLAKNQIGWDWFCIQLQNNEEIMLYLMRDDTGKIDPASEGTWVQADGTAQRIALGEFQVEKIGTWKSPKSGATYPAGWQMTLPRQQAELTVEPAQADQELYFSGGTTPAYWEGACRIEGTVAGAKVSGVGYTELTGYAGALGSGLR